MALDNFRTQKIIWDRANRKIFEAIEANAGDSNGRKLVVQVINQETTESLSGTTLSLGWKSRSGAKGLDAFNLVDASKGIFEIYYTTEMLSNIGNIEASFILIDSTSRIESSTFTISVRPSTVDDESVESENSFTALTEALVKVNDLEANYAPRLNEVTAQLAQTITRGRGELTEADLSQDLKETLTGGNVAVVGKNSVLSENVVDGQITPIKTPYLEPTKTSNLISPYNITFGYSFNGLGELYEDDLGIIYDYVKVKAGVKLKTSGINLNRVIQYDAAKNNPEGLVSFVGNPAEFTPTIDGYIRIGVKVTSVGQMPNLKLAVADNFDETVSDYLIKSDVLRVGKNNIEKEAIGEEEVETASLGAGKMSFISNSSNFFNKKDAEVGFFTNEGGGKAPNDSYFTSHRIYASNQTDWVIKNVLTYQIYNSAGTMVDSGRTSGTEATKVITVPVDGYFTFSSLVTNINSAQVNKGSTLLDFEPYAMYFEDLSFTPQQKQLLVSPEKNEGVLVEKNGENFKISSSMENGERIEIETVRNGSFNETFNFVKTTVNGQIIHSNNDDIAPIRTFSTVGANHGYAVIRKITMSGHEKTRTDLGSTWTDGTTIFTLLKIEGNDLFLAPPYTESNGMVTAVGIDPTGNLTHVSGATNTTPISVTTIAGAQLYPSVNKISVKYLLDGKDVTSDGTHSGNTLQVVEKYDIMDYKSIIDFAQNNIGMPYYEADIAGVVSIGNTYTFTKGLKCTTSHGIKALKKVRMGQCGFLQSVQIALSGHDRIRYMPGINLANYNFNVGVNLNDFTTNELIKNAQLVDPTTPPSHYIDWLKDSNGNKKYGFSMGYVVDKTNTKNTDRLNNTSTYWDLRNTRKSYPIAIENLTLEAGDYISGQGFRNYLVGEEVGEAINANVVSDAKDSYLYLMFDSAREGYEKDMSADIGKKISLIQTSGVDLINDTVDSAGVIVKATSAGSAIAKVE